jgi:2-iminobutanoate/2-iminopropanoate deaminase
MFPEGGHGIRVDRAAFSTYPDQTFFERGCVLAVTPRPESLQSGQALAVELCSDGAPCHPFSSLRVTGGLVFLSGQGGFADHKLVDGGVAAETAQIFRKVGALLESVGASLDDVVSCVVHLADLSDYAAFDEEYAKHFPREKPVRTTVRADLLFGMHVEITVIAKQP